MTKTQIRRKVIRKEFINKTSYLLIEDKGFQAKAYAHKLEIYKRGKLISVENFETAEQITFGEFISEKL